MEFNPKRCACGRIASIYMDYDEGPEWCDDCAVACGDECCGFNYYWVGDISLVQLSWLEDRAKEQEKEDGEKDQQRGGPSGGP
jgi:hypothetical protein